jgi:tetratricopeptide (TPR) repeat protein
VLIARYKGIVLGDPSAPFPLQRLAELYRQRDGKLDALISELEEQAGKTGADRFNALLALAGIYRQDGQHDRARQTYERAVTEQPKSAPALIALAHLLADRGDRTGARARYEQALPLIKDDAGKELTLRTLIALDLDAKDFDAAKKHHKDLVVRAHGSYFVRAELGRELMQRGEYERAVTEFRENAKQAGGDNRVLAPALRDLGAALAKAGKADEAVAELRRALGIAGDQAGVKREIYSLIADVYRGQDRLRDLITEIEKDPRKDAGELKLLGSLYEESGQIDKALGAYKRALVSSGKDMETRLKVVQLLQIQGELDAAIVEYEALIAAAPHNPDFVFQLAEALIQRGDRTKALAQLAKLEARSSGDPDTMTALADFYERVGEQERAVKLQERLAATTQDDPRFLVDLGNRYWESGDKKKAEATWQRIRLVVQDRAKALITLGDVYLNHDLNDQALDAYRQAIKVKPDDKRVQRAFALAVERTGAAAPSTEQRARQYAEARKI